MKRILFVLCLVLGFSAILPFLSPKDNRVGAWVLLVNPTTDCKGWDLHITTYGMTVTHVEPSEKGNWTYSKQKIHYKVDATSPEGDRHAEGDLSRPKENCTPIPPPKCEKKGCVVIDPQPLECRTELGARVHQLFDGKRELYEGAEWMQVNEGAKITVTVFDGHLRNSLLHAVLLPTKEYPEGEKLGIQMQVGIHVVATNEHGTLIQDNCYRITGKEQQGSGSVSFSLAAVPASDPCIDLPK